MELATTDGKKEIVKGRVVYLKLPQWVCDLPRNLRFVFAMASICAGLILILIITYSRLQAVLV